MLEKHNCTLTKSSRLPLATTLSESRIDAVVGVAVIEARVTRDDVERLANSRTRAKRKVRGSSSPPEMVDAAKGAAAVAKLVRRSFTEGPLASG